MKNALTTLNLMILAVLVTVVVTNGRAEARRVGADVAAATIGSLPLVESHSLLLQLGDLPIDNQTLAPSSAARVVVLQTTPQAGLVLTHVSAEVNAGQSIPCDIIIDGVPTFRAGLREGSNVAIASQQMSPILVRPGQLLRIEVLSTNTGVLNIQGYGVSNSDLY